MCTAPALLCVRMEGPLLWAEGQVSLASIQRSTPNRQSHDSSLRVGTRPRILPTQYCTVYTAPPPSLGSIGAIAQPTPKGVEHPRPLGLEVRALSPSKVQASTILQSLVVHCSICLQTRASLAFTRFSNSAILKHLLNCSSPVSILFWTILIGILDKLVSLDIALWSILFFAVKR